MEDSSLILQSEQIRSFLRQENKASRRILWLHLLWFHHLGAEGRAGQVANMGEHQSSLAGARSCDLVIELDRSWPTGSSLSGPLLLRRGKGYMLTFKSIVEGRQL